MISSYSLNIKFTDLYTRCNVKLEESLRNKTGMNLKNRIYLLLFIILIICIFYYIYQFIKFDIKVKKFNEEILIGMTITEVEKILGKPSQILYDFQNKEISEKVGLDPEIGIDEYYYEGAFFLRDDLILYFHSVTKKLMYKERASVIVSNPK